MQLLSLFAQARVSNPSQRRFVHYAREISRGRLIASEKARKITIKRVCVRSCTLGKRIDMIVIKLVALGRITPVSSQTVIVSRFA